MSTDIKPGQVWAWNDGRAGPGPEITVTSLGEYQGGDGRVNYSHSDDLDVFDVDLASFREKAHLVKDVDATPAPLDPSKVKAGDTVTLENGETSVRGPVAHIEKALPMDVVLGFSIRNVGWRYIAPGVVAQQEHGVWTLTDHQPAPEPEPEWEPGTTGYATVSRLDDVFSLRVMRVEWDGLYGFATESGRIVADAENKWSVSDFVPDEPRPLPTREQVIEALRDGTAKAYPALGDRLRPWAEMSSDTRKHYDGLADAVMSLYGGAR